MSVESLFILLVVGAAMGCLAGVLVKGYGVGYIGNAAVGALGAVLAGMVLPWFGFAFEGSRLGAVVQATCGAASLLALIGIMQRA